MSLHEMVEQVLRLPEGDRAVLAARLIESLGESSEAISPDDWDAEIRSRLQDIDGDAVELVPWEDVRRQLRDDASGNAS